MINLGNNREVFWDSYLVDEEKTTAFQRLMHPELKSECFVFDKPGEEDISFISLNILKDENGLYRLYYIPYNWNEGSEHRNVRVAISEDGINWERPNLNIFEHPELEQNNIVFDHSDWLFVFRDTNPDCKPEERYKAVTPYYNTIDGVTHLELWSYVSPDGFHFNILGPVADDTEGHFDSLNTVLWRDGKYYCYFRSLHDKDGNDVKWWDTNFIRDIRVKYSTDFINWTSAKHLNYDDGNDFALYNNDIYPYERAPQLLVGFPTRYINKGEWSQNTEQLASAENKKNVIAVQEERAGLCVTDGLFMCSRDGENWHRFTEAFLPPAYENEDNWVYGDGYLAYNLVDSGKQNYYLYSIANSRSLNKNRVLNCYEIRKDGFACYMADGTERTLVTKPLVFNGKDLHLNFSTSAFGYIFVDVLDEEGNELSKKQSFEIYGNTIDRKVCFADGTDFAEFANKPVRLRFRMREAKLFALKFE